MSTSFNYYYSSRSDTLDVILHGSSHDINTPFMKKVFNVCREKGHSVLAFNLLFTERGEDHSSGPELNEELQTLQKMLEYVYSNNFRRIRFIGKSLGGIVASFYVDSLKKAESDRFSVVILGYVCGSLRLNRFIGSIAVIQGEKDKFGNIGAVKTDLKNAISKDIRLIEIKNTDHSYRKPETKEPLYEDKALEVFSGLN